MKDQWTLECESQLSKAEECISIIMERNRAVKLGLEVSKYDEKLNDHLSSMKSAKIKLEQQLSNFEMNGVTQGANSADLSQKDDMLSKLEKKIILIEKKTGGMSSTSGSPSRNTYYQDSGSALPTSKIGEESLEGKNNTEINRMHRTLIQEQDIHLDQLADVVSRQKNIGLTISDELDYQANILDDLDRTVDNTHGRVSNARRRLDRLLGGSSDTRNICIIVLLIVIIIILIILL